VEFSFCENIGKNISDDREETALNHRSIGINRRATAAQSSANMA
jgi:hypothetical protein